MENVSETSCQFMTTMAWRSAKELYQWNCLRTYYPFYMLVNTKCVSDTRNNRKHVANVIKPDTLQKNAPRRLNVGSAVQKITSDAVAQKISAFIVVKSATPQSNATEIFQSQRIRGIKTLRPRTNNNYGSTMLNSLVYNSNQQATKKLKQKKKKKPRQQQGRKPKTPATRIKEKNPINHNTWKRKSTTRTRQPKISYRAT